MSSPKDFLDTNKLSKLERKTKMQTQFTLTMFADLPLCLSKERIAPV